jgi:hypothetical protein
VASGPNLNPSARNSLQFRVLGLGLRQYRYAGVSILPEREEVLVGRFRLGDHTLRRESSCEAEVRKRIERIDGRPTLASRSQEQHQWPTLREIAAEW